MGRRWSRPSSSDPGKPESTGDYAPTIDWGDGTAPDSSTPLIVANGDGTFSVLAHHVYTEESSAGKSYPITIAIRHEETSLAFVRASAVVSDPAPVLVADGFGLVSGEGFDTGAVTLATFADPGGPERSGNYAASVDWGDGSGPTPLRPPSLRKPMAPSASSRITFMPRRALTGLRARHPIGSR